MSPNLSEFEIKLTGYFCGEVYLRGGVQGIFCPFSSKGQHRERCKNRQPRHFCELEWK